jgi:hypothetical protein
MSEGNERELIQIKRRRGNMLKFIRQGHEAQFDRMDDFEMLAMMQDIGANMSQRQVLTMLQDLQVMGWITFKQFFSQEKERMVAEEIMLTAVGLALVVRRRNTEEVLFD